MICKGCGYEGKPRMNFSHGKITYFCRKCGLVVSINKMEGTKI